MHIRGQDFHGLPNFPWVDFRVSNWSQDEPTEPHTRATATHGCGRTSSALVALHFCIFSGGVPRLESDRAQKVKKFQQNSFEERSTRSGKLESKILQQSEMLEEFLYCTYLRQASEQRLLAELAAWQRMCAEQSCKPQARILPKTSSKSGCLSSSLVFNSLAKMMFQLMNGMKVCSWRASALLHMPLALPQARATEKLDMDSLPLKDREPLGDKCPDLFNSPFPPFPQAQEVWICTKVWPHPRWSKLNFWLHPLFIQDP